MKLNNKNTQIIKLFEEYSNNNKIFNHVRNKYFKSDIIDFEVNQIDGYKVLKDKVVFGSSYSYNDTDPYYLLHEMGHFVSIKNKNRLLKNYYGLEYSTKVEIGGDLYEEPITWNGIKNELKAVAYQEVLSNSIIGHFPLESWITSFKLMSDFINVPLYNTKQDKDYENYDLDTNEKIPFSQREERRLMTIREEYKKYINKNKSLLNINNFDRLWFERVRFIENKLK